GERPPDGRIEAAERADRVPAGPDDVPRVQGRGGQPAGRGLLFEHPRDPVLLDAVIPERGGAGAALLRDRDLATRAVAPDRPAVQEMRELTAQPVDQRRRRIEREADEVDEDVGTQPGDPVPEAAVAVLL